MTDDMAGEPGARGEPGWQRLVVERHGPIVRIWLARPDKRNALDTQTLEELIAVFGSLATAFDVRVAVLGGQGPSFCGGADRSSPPGADRLVPPIAGGRAPEDDTPGRGPVSGDPPAEGGRSGGVTLRQRRWWAQLGRRACAAVADAEVVTIARLQGHVVGGGLCLGMACDLRIAADDAQLSLPEVDLGLPLTWGSTARLVHEVGAARARELIFFGEPIDGTRAEGWGLVHRSVPAGELDAAVDDWAGRLAAKPEIAIHMAKSQLRALARRAELGDTTETDGDLLILAGAAAAAAGRPTVGPTAGSARPT